MKWRKIGNYLPDYGGNKRRSPGVRILGLEMGVTEVTLCDLVSTVLQGIKSQGIKSRCYKVLSHTKTGSRFFGNQENGLGK